MALPDLRVGDRECGARLHLSGGPQPVAREAGLAPLLLMIGQDAANALHTWHEWRRLFELAHLVVMRRPDAHFNCRGELRAEIERRRVREPARLLAAASGLVLPLEITQLDISSTHIRGLLAAGRSARFLLPDRVLDYIREQGLYSAGE
jgi:nicotinate-nucleotide adenylyltransferase